MHSVNKSDVWYPSVSGKVNLFTNDYSKLLSQDTGSNGNKGAYSLLYSSGWLKELELSNEPYFVLGFNWMPLIATAMVIIQLC